MAAPVHTPNARHRGAGQCSMCATSQHFWGRPRRTTPRVLDETSSDATRPRAQKLAAFVQRRFEEPTNRSARLVNHGVDELVEES
jgi:hypothetical protein